MKTNPYNICPVLFIICTGKEIIFYDPFNMKITPKGIHTGKQLCLFEHSNSNQGNGFLCQKNNHKNNRQNSFLFFFFIDLPNYLMNCLRQGSKQLLQYLVKITSQGKRNSHILITIRIIYLKLSQYNYFKSPKLCFIMQQK